MRDTFISLMTNLEMSFLGTAPSGKQCSSNGGVTNGPGVWPLSSFEIAAETSVGCSLADNKLLDKPNENSP